MKKIITFILVFALIMSMSVTAFAADGAVAGNTTVDNINDDNTVDTTFASDDSTKVDAYGRIDTDGDGKAEGDDEDPSSTSVVIAVDLKWDAMEWVYSTNGTYDAENMITTGAKWNDADKYITVENRSNAGITAGFAYNATIANTALLFEAEDANIGVVPNSDPATKEGSWDADTKTLTLNAANQGTAASGEQEQVNGTPADAKVTVSLDLQNHTAAITDDNTKIGTITITIAKAA